MPEARTPPRWLHAAESPADPARVADLARTLHITPLAARLLLQRELADNHDHARAFLRPTLGDLPDPLTLPGCADAAERLAHAVRDRRAVIIYGDYDVDGVSASAILFHTLHALWRKQHGDRQTPAVACYVPHRIDEGYGLNADAIARFAQPAFDDFAAGHLRDATPGPPLVVTVDCGITAVEPARVARALNLTLIITDHHGFDGHDLPDADALVHPSLHGTDTISPPPCGAGVAFLLAWQTACAFVLGDAARTPLRHRNARLPEDLQLLLCDLLALAALGTVADVVPLRGMNRLVTRFGLLRIKDTRFEGLNKLIDAARLRSERVDAYHIGFVLGPRLNACGRMGHARQAVELLTTATGEHAAEIAEFLTDENDARRATEREVFTAACAQIDADHLATDHTRAIVLAGEGWHPGVVGIVASRLVERYHRPVVLLAQTNGHAKGSGRSVAGVDLRAALCDCAEHLEKFGGHAMAAGLSLATDAIEAFRAALVARINAELSVDDLTPCVRYDLDADGHDLSVEAFEQLEQLAPFGPGNPTPRLLLRKATLADPVRRIGSTGAHAALRLRLGRAAIRAVAFNQADTLTDCRPGDTLDVIAEPSINNWGGRRTAELKVCGWRPADAGMPE